MRHGTDQAFEQLQHDLWGGLGDCPGQIGANRLNRHPKDAVYSSTGDCQCDYPRPPVGRVREASNQALLLKEKKHGSHRVLVGRGAGGQFLLCNRLPVRECGQQNELVGRHTMPRESRVRASVHCQVSPPQGHRELVTGHCSHRSCTYAPDLIDEYYDDRRSCQRSKAKITGHPGWVCGRDKSLIVARRDVGAAVVEVERLRLRGQRAQPSFVAVQRLPAGIGAFIVHYRNPRS
jgi:hypothetical protein